MSARRLYELVGAESDRRFSPYCWRIRMALAHKELPAETVPWHFTEKAAIAPSGHGTVPVLVDGVRWVTDSWAIANYLEDTYPERPSLFGGGAGRALSRFYSQWGDTVLHGGLFPMLVADIHRHLDAASQPYFRQTREARLGRSLEAAAADRDQRVEDFRHSLEPLRRTVAAQPFLGGDAPLYADYAIFGGFQWARAISPFQTLAAEDPITLWRERMLDRFDGLARRAKAYPG